MFPVRRLPAAMVLSFLVALALRAEPPAPARAPLRTVHPETCVPAPSDATRAWWMNGWLDGTPREPALLAFQAGHLEAVFDPFRATLTHLGLNRRGIEYGTGEEPFPSPTSADALLRHRPARLELTVRSGSSVFRCTRAATNRQDWMNFPVRLIESGRFLQRWDIQQLVFEDAAGQRLDAEARLEIVAWPDQLHFLLEVTPAHTNLTIAPQVRLVAGRPFGTRDSHPLLARSDAPQPVFAAALAITPDPTDGDSEADPAPAPGLAARDFATGAALAVTRDPDRGWQRIVLPARSWDVAREPDHLERIRVALTNDSPRPRIARLLFDDPTGTPGITGLTPMLRDADGFPTGIPVQTSKNWHRQEKRRLLHEGPWLHAFTLLRLPPNSRVDLEFTLAWARWGGVPAASHAQLCLIGWGWNQLWEQAAIGSWGESICYEPDAIQQRCRIDDVRPLMVWGMGEGRRQWTWTHNVGGGDFLLYFDAAGRYQPWRAVRTTYLSQGPNLTDVRYSGITADDRIACRVEVSLPRTDDLTRVYHRLRYDVLAPTPFQRLAFYQVGSDRYHWHQYGKLARGNADGLIEEWNPGRGGKTYLRTGIPCPGDAPWFSLHDAVAADGGKPVAGAWAARGLILRSWKARLGGRDAPPFAAVFGTAAGNIPSANLELAPPPTLDTLQPGDFVEAEVEFVVLPLSADDYYGPNENLRASLRESGNTWRSVHRQAAGNHLRLRVERGRLTAEYPPVVAVDRRQRAEFAVTGGVGYLPVTFTGLARPRGWRLERDDGAGWQPVDQSVHGHDFWQARHDPATRSWSVTVNLPMDSPHDAPVERRLRLVSATGESRIANRQSW